VFETITNYAGYLENISFLTYPVTLFLGFPGLHDVYHLLSASCAGCGRFRERIRNRS